MDKCCAKLRGSDWGYRPSCTRTAKVERDGKHYCAIHDPVRAEQKRQERNATWEAKWKAERDERRRGQAEAALKDRALAAIRVIADGHNDPRALALEVLSTPSPEPEK